MKKHIVSNYEWPEELYPLREWLRRKGVDVDALKSERQAYWMARTLGGQNTKFPRDRSRSLFPYLMKLQRTLCPNGLRQSAPAKRESFIQGTFGAASDVRRIDPADYLKMKAGGPTS